MKSRQILIVICLACCTNARAHHGRDFLLLQDALLPSPGEWIAFANAGFASEAGPDEASLEAGFTVGLVPRLALTATVGYGDYGHGSWDWSSATPMLHLDLTPGGRSLPFRMALVAGREFSLAGDHSHLHVHEENPGIWDPGFDPGPDWSPPPVGVIHDHGGGGHSHAGIHQHGIDAWHARLIAEMNLGEKTRLVGNLIALFPDDGNAALGYALGLRHEVSHGFAAGLEATGDFSRHRHHEALAAVYLTPMHALTVKLGAGTGIGSRGPDYSLRAGLVWRF